VFRFWSAIVLAERNWARILWHHVPSPEGMTKAEAVKEILEKKTMINVAGAFAVALKHYLRGEPGVGYKVRHTSLN
jgi:putative membrane protein